MEITYTNHEGFYLPNLTLEGLHLCKDLPHGQNVFRIGILL